MFIKETDTYSREEAVLPKSHFYEERVINKRS